MAEHFRTCPLCEAMCGLRIEHERGTVTSIRGDERDPLSRGYLCPKGPALRALQEDPDRLRHPMRRVDDRFERVSWEDAFELAAEGIHRVQEAHGRNAVATYVGNPTAHNPAALIFTPMLIRALRTRNRFSATSVDQLPHHFVSHLMFGHQFLLPVPDVDHAELMWIVGANPLASNGSLMSAPNMLGRLRAIGARGGRVVVIDPRRTETAKLADEHVFIRPGADAWLLAAVLRITLRDGRGLGRLGAHAEHIDTLRDAMEPFTIERAAERSAVDAKVIERLAAELCAAERAVVYGRFGVSTQRFGALCQWMINAINLSTGNFDREGGVMFPTPAIDIVNARVPGMGVGRGSVGRWRSRVRDLPEFGGELPVATLADEILEEGEGQVRALVTSAGNPVLSTPNGSRLDEALGGLEHMVSVDFYINETTRHADVILPPPSPLERVHFDIAFHQLAVRNTAKLSLPLFEPEPGTRRDSEIVLGLIEALQRQRGRWSAREAVRHAAMLRLGTLGVIDLGLRAGGHGARLWPPRIGLSAKRLLASPHGVDLGPLRPTMPQGMKRWRERIDLAPEALVSDLERLRDMPAHDGSLQLIGRRHLRSNNSWLHNVPKLMAGKPICTLLMHPEDAGSRDIADGNSVRIRSRVGEIEVDVELSDDVMPGVVSLPHGFGHDRPNVQLRVARAHAGASINDLTDEQMIDSLAGTAALSGVPVEVEPA